MSKQINDNEHGPGVGEGYWWCSCSSPTPRDSGQDVARDPEITAAPLGPWSLGAFCLMTGSLKKSSVSYIYEHDDNKQAKFLFFFFFFFLPWRVMAMAPLFSFHSIQCCLKQLGHSFDSEYPQSWDSQVTLQQQQQPRGIHWHCIGGGVLEIPG